MLKTICTLLALIGLVSAPALQAEDGWITMFNGKDLTGWKSNEEVPGVFTVTPEGTLKVEGGRAHLFFVGADGAAKFTNFEFKAKVMTTAAKPGAECGSNSGLYFHTDYQEKGWPDKGFECQVNSTHKDRKKTGGLYAVKDVLDNAPSKDGEWCDYGIKVEGKHVTITINGVVSADWTQPEDWDPTKALKGMPGRKLGSGTMAIQGHDPQSTTFFKDLSIRALP
jgi:hypothetical protein